MENWKNINGFEGRYEVSDQGRIRSNSRKIKGVLGGVYETPIRILNPPVYDHGYAVVKLYTEGKAKRKAVHILVAEAFLDNKLNKPIVNHIDGNKLNNQLSNLEWVTSQENHTHAAIHGLKAKGESHGFSRLKTNEVVKIKELLASRLPQRVIAKQFGVCQATIKDIKQGKTWAHVHTI